MALERRKHIQSNTCFHHKVNKLNSICIPLVCLRGFMLFNSVGTFHHLENVPATEVAQVSHENTYILIISWFWHPHVSALALEALPWCLRPPALWAFVDVSLLQPSSWVQHLYFWELECFWYGTQASDILAPLVTPRTDSNSFKLNK